MAYNMGIGAIGLNPGITFKRKFRWTFAVKDICVGGTKDGPQSTIPESFVKTASRPSLSFDETEIHFLHGRMRLPGKVDFDTLTVTYYDVTQQQGDPLAPLYTWIASVYDFLSPEGGIANPRMGNNAFGAQGYGGTGILNMLDGTGKVLETWTLFDCWPQTVNFGDLDYSNSEEANIELTLRYQFAKWKSYCGGDIKPCFDQSCGSDIGPLGGQGPTAREYTPPRRSAGTGGVVLL